MAQVDAPLRIPDQPTLAAGSVALDEKTLQQAPPQPTEPEFRSVTVWSKFEGLVPDVACEPCTNRDKLNPDVNKLLKEPLYLTFKVDQPYPSNARINARVALADGFESNESFARVGFELEKPGKAYEVVTTRHSTPAVLIFSEQLEKLQTISKQLSPPAAAAPPAAGTDSAAPAAATTTTTTTETKAAEAAALAETLLSNRRAATQLLADAYMRAFVRGTEEQFKYLVVTRYRQLDAGVQAQAAMHAARMFLERNERSGVCIAFIVDDGYESQCAYLSAMNRVFPRATATGEPDLVCFESDTMCVLL